MLSTRFADRLRAMAQLDQHDLEVMNLLNLRPRMYRRGEDVIREGDDPEVVHLVQSGLAFRYHMVDDGRRQISGYLLPGDSCNLHVALLNRLDHSIGVLSDARIIEMPMSAVSTLLSRPRLAYALFKAVLIDESILRQWIVNVGRRSAAKSIAHLFCELQMRFAAVGLADESFALPITQMDLADTVALSAVHVNRSLAHLRTANLAHFTDGQVSIPNVEKLRQFADFDPGYLHLNEPRQASTKIKVG